ncbi:hypothetical protein AMTR_s00052p00152130 [Amborella trichopoda]|uniref:Uncharacterized protein n=1 Tax=Amborella trichopoda TaxID=13333 RepID=U5CT28_AMBTC|nr:hypothetical protein AMTR_s00052p00152130 [Amborella trichopoda]
MFSPLTKLAKKSPGIKEEHAGDPTGLLAGGIATTSTPEGSPSDSCLKLNEVEPDLSSRTKAVSDSTLGARMDAARVESRLYVPPLSHA